MNDIFDIHAPKNESGGVGEYLTTVYEYNDIGEFMKNNSLEFVFVKSNNTGCIHTFELNDFK